MSPDYWPFWAGAGALAGVGTLHFALAGRTLGVSGAYQKVLQARAEAAALRAEDAARADPAAFEAAMLAATLAQFGPADGAGAGTFATRGGADCSAPAVANGTFATRGDVDCSAPALAPGASALVNVVAASAALADCAAPAPGAGATAAARVPWTASALMLVMIAVGAAVARLLSRGSLSAQWSMGETFSSLFGQGPLSWAVLVLGGAMVGFGTRMAGGCTSGHGLSGVSRGQVSSVIATCAFMASAVALSIFLHRVLS